MFHFTTDFADFTDFGCAIFWGLHRLFVLITAAKAAMGYAMAKSEKS